VGKIELSLQEYDALRARARELQRQVNEAEAARDAALTQDPSGRIPILTSAILDAFEVVRFAVGNLDPRTVREWPYKELDRFANVLKDLPGAPPIPKETALEFIGFAYEARLLEEDRAAHPENYPSQPTQVTDEGDNAGDEKAAT
jgi:hypothetical protein